MSNPKLAIETLLAFENCRDFIETVNADSPVLDEIDSVTKRLTTDVKKMRSSWRWNGIPKALREYFDKRATN